MRIGFTPKQVTRLTEIPYSTLNLWARKGLIRPSISEGKGSGSERIYSFSDLVALKVAFELRKAGVTTNSLANVIQFLHEIEGMEKPLAEARLVVSGRDVLIARNDRELVSVLSHPGQSCLSFVVDLPRSVGKLSEIAAGMDAFAMGLAEPRDAAPHKRKAVASVSRKERRPSKILG